MRFLYGAWPLGEWSSQQNFNLQRTERASAVRGGDGLDIARKCKSDHNGRAFGSELAIWRRRWP